MASLRESILIVVLLAPIGLFAAASANASQDDLIGASAAGDLSRVKAMLATMKDVNAKGANGMSAILVASRSGHLALSMHEKLTRRGISQQRQKVERFCGFRQRKTCLSG